MIELHPKYLIFLGGAESADMAKTGRGLAFWAPERCAGQYRIDDSAADVGLTTLGFEEAVSAGARTLVVGITGIGGKLHESWTPHLLAAMEAGLDLAAGLHGKLNAHPVLSEAAKRLGRRMIDVRVPPAGIEVGTGRKRSGKRVLMVGTDCALGKKFTALALHQAMVEAGAKATFRATGQTGIFIAGEGMPMDSVVADFASGAAEELSPDNEADHWDVIEGQGSLFHPGFAAVSLGLLHGSQPDALVICHEAGRKTINAYPDFPTPSLTECIDLHLRMARLTNPAVKAVAISLNTSKLDEAAASEALAAAEAETGLPAADPIRFGAARLADAVLNAGSEG
ncbi:MAG: DUF1611 domain-containing protein [Alphaproteobacteria bacterium]|nr:DUF1611 domain-containing protein [Alphaproteobacteria bacterium]